MKVYHATAYDNLGSILEKGLEANRNVEHCVFVCEKPEQAAMFLRIRGYDLILVCECEVKPEALVKSYDHNQNIFPFDAYMHMGDIPPTKIENYLKYDFRRKV